MHGRRAVMAAGLAAAAWAAAPDDAVSQSFGAPADQQLAQHALRAAWEDLASTARIQGDTLYVDFRLGGAPPRPPPSGGFAAPLQARPASPFVRSGVMAINLFQPQATTIRPGDNAGNGWRGQVEFRIYRYALYDFPQRRWGPWHLVTLHFWNWDAYQRDGALRLMPDRQTGGDAIGPTEFIASVFGVAPAAVQCRPAR
jgi:hypothetical protein